MLLTIEQIAALGQRLDDARKDPVFRCQVSLVSEGRQFRLEPKPRASRQWLAEQRELGLIEDMDSVPHLKVALGVCGYRSLAIDPETQEICCAVHGKVGY